MLKFEVIEKEESDIITIRATCDLNNYIDRTSFIKPTNKGIKKRKINKQKKELTLAYETAIMLQGHFWEE